ncbi:MAG TPA: Gfo/Idh/MocA family oxidoreductase [Armatimonadetes bacterium]|jgi:predicted dehydrogenase|nr:Gfo/Idh/MocA family oxidoreductase [Armatimonadota bacterium]
MNESLPVAVIGAGRIGRQHAKWYHAAGCRVVGFLGSSEESVGRTQAALQEMLGVAIPGYTDFERLVSETRPVAVSVCSPHALHCQHVLQAVDAGVAVLCEKPLAWDEGKSHAEILLDARRMVAAAEKKQVLLALNAQYVAGLPAYMEWYAQMRGPLDRPRRYEAVMQSRGRGGGAEYEDIWIDLGSHPLSLIVKWSPSVHIEPGSIHCVLRRKEVVADFRCVAANGNLCECSIRLGNVPEGKLERRFGVNDFLLEYAGRNNPEGVFHTYLRHGDEEREYPDLLLMSIEAFVRAVRGEGEPLISGAEGLRNLELQIEILEHAVVEQGAAD